MPNEPVARINRLTDQPKTTPTQAPSGEQVQNNLQFSSNMEMTGWVLIVGNVAPCVVHPEGTKVSV